MQSAESAEITQLGRVHIMGIGGAGMSGIARVMLAQGVSVSGCDAKDSRRLQALRALGAEISIGHDAQHCKGADTLVVSTAIPKLHPEVTAAAESQMPVLSRAQALAAVMLGSEGVAVSGTHGKTTTTSMITVTLQHCGVDPSFVIGSELNETGSNAHLGSGNYFVVEADESDGSFLALPSKAGIITNIEPDHLNYWGDFDSLRAAFKEFVLGICGRDGFVVMCADDPGAAQLAAECTAEGLDVRTYGDSAEADYRMLEPRLGHQGWGFDVVHSGVRLGHVDVHVPGKHNALNALGAVTLCLGLGLPVHDVLSGIGQFTGTRRRFDFKGSAAGVRVFDDYAHHPTEIEATLRAAREVAGSGRVIVAFQAHHYYRTALFLREFGEALGLADEVVVLEIFAPGETPVPGVSGQTMAAGVPLEDGCVVFEPSFSAVPRQLAERAQPGDIVMTLGAGDIGLMAPEVLELLRDRDLDRA
jgi:UDP-N-acetylmuramate--alanine ligase